MRGGNIRGFLLASTIEGVFAIGLIFRFPSAAGNVWFLGYSVDRIALGLAALAPLSIFTWLSIKSIFDRNWLSRVSKFLADWLREADRALSTMFMFLLTFLLGAALLIYYKTSYASSPGFFRLVFDRANSMVFWMTAISLQALIVVISSFRNIHPQKVSFTRQTTLKALIPILIFFAALIHWVILYFRLPVFTRLNHWFWYFRTRSDLVGWIFYILAALSLGVVFIVLNKPISRKRKLVLLFLLGYSLQVGFGFIEGQGFESLRGRLTSLLGHSEYAIIASQDQITIDSIRNYEKLYGERGFLGTKPPGVLSFNVLTQKISNLLSPAETFEGRYQRQTTFSAYVYPAFSLLILIIIYSISRRYLNEKDATLSLLFYITCPNIILMTWALDQILYPILFMLAFFLGMIASRKASFRFAVLSGFMIIIALFFSFSLLPLILFTTLWILLDVLLNKRSKRLSGSLKVMLGIGIGLLVGLVFFKLVLNYDPLLRYRNAMEIHRSIKGFRPVGRKILAAIFPNLVEFATWIGFPIFILFILGALKAVKAGIKRQLTPWDGTMIAFLITFAALNFLGQTAGEVGRLWLFLVPIIVISASEQTNKLFTRRGSGVYLIILSQLITTFLIFKNQYPYY